jgi:hypothetical protein
VQAPQIAQQRRFRRPPQIQHRAPWADPPREAGGPKHDDVPTGRALERRMQVNAPDIQAEIAQRQFDEQIAARCRHRDGFAIEADDPRQHVRQHRAPQGDVGVSGSDHSRLDRQIGLEHRASLDQAKHPGVVAGAAVDGEDDVRETFQVAPAVTA